MQTTASKANIESALSYASAVSLSIETPGSSHFSKLTDRKDYRKDSIEPLTFIAEQTGRGGSITVLIRGSYQTRERGVSAFSTLKVLRLPQATLRKARTFLRM